MKPSFAAKVRQSMDHWRETVEIHPELSALTDKPVLYQLLAGFGAPLPVVQDVIDGLHNLSPHHFNTPTVVKPTRSASGRAVAALEPKGHQRWSDIIGDREFTWDELIDWLQRVRGRHGFSDQWMTEALLRNPYHPELVADDFKVYAFMGQVGVILQRRTRPTKRHRWFAPDWKPVDTGKYRDMIDTTLEIPAVTDRQLIVELASSLSQVLPRPFVRVDFLASSDGVRVNEMTPHPGGFHRFNSEWDERLGAMWGSAEVRLDQQRADERRLLMRRIEALETSTSWKVTAPLRALGGLRRKVIGR